MKYSVILLALLAGCAREPDKYESRFKMLETAYGGLVDSLDAQHTELWKIRERVGMTNGIPVFTTR